MRCGGSVKADLFSDDRCSDIALLLLFTEYYTLCVLLMCDDD